MIKINLLPNKRALEQKAAQLQLGAVVCVLAFTFVGLWFAGHSFGKDLESTQAKVSELQGEKRALAAEVAEIARLNKQEEELERKLALIQKLERGKKGPVRLLDDIARAGSKRVWLRSIEEKEGGRIELKGRAMANIDIADFLDKLSKSSQLRQVELGDVTQLEEDGVLLYQYDIGAVVAGGSLE